MSRYRFIGVLFLLCVTFVVALARSGVVKPGDSIRLNVEEEPTLSKDYVITRDGYIVLQFVGAIPIAGETEQEASEKISKALLDQRILARATTQVSILNAKGQLISYTGAVDKSGDIYPREGLRLADVVKIAKPNSGADLSKVQITTAEGKQFTVDFTLYNGKDESKNPEVRAGDNILFPLADRPKEITVVGRVGKPGVLPFVKGMTAKKAIDSAGGITELGDAKAIKIERDKSPLQTIDYSQSDSVELMQGDMITVPQLNVIYYVTVLGAVKTAQRLVYREGMTLSQAIDAAGGATPNADLKHVQISRVVDGKNKVLKQDITGVKSGMSGDVRLLASDNIEIPARKGKHGKNNNLLKIAGGAVLAVGLGILHF